jgi:hypothetical protein
MPEKPSPKPRSKGGNGKTPERRADVDRRIGDQPYEGPNRRRGSRRSPDRLPDKPIKR